MKKQMRWAAAVAAVVVGGMTSSAYAGMEFIGAYESESWVSEWVIDVSSLTGGDFDELRITLDNSLGIPGFESATTTSQFETPTVLADFDVDSTNAGTSTGGWTQISASSSAATADGNSTEYLFFSVHATDDITDGIQFRLQTYLNGVLIGEGVAGYQQISDTAYREYHEFHLVPLPPALLSGLALMGGLGGMVMRRRRNRATLA